MPKKPETRRQKKIRRALEREFGGFWFKHHGSEFSEVGIPDLIGCVGGFYVGVEVKEPGETAEAIQKTIHKKIRGAGGICVTSCSESYIISVVREALESAKGRRIIYLEKKRVLPRHGNGHRKDSYDISEPSHAKLQRRR